ncbi:MAG TPA: ABC transporter permease [Solirubrobacterales bacterium]
MSSRGAVTGPSAPPSSSNGGPGRARHGARDFGEKYGLLFVFAAVVAFFGLWDKTGSVFLSHSNIVQLIGGQMVLVLVALAVMLPLNSGYFDLSAGAITGVASVTCAALMSKTGAPLAVAAVAGIAMGTLLGVVNGILVSRFRLSSVITTLAMSIALGGLMQWYTKGQIISNHISHSFLKFGSSNWLGIPKLAYVVIPIVLIVWYVQEYTVWGRYQQAVNSSDQASRLVGVNVDRAVFMSFVLAGLVAGIAGVLLVARAGGADATTGPSFLFPALAAVFLGAATIRPGRANALGTLVGVFFVAISVSGLTLAGASSWVAEVFNGGILFIAAALSAVFARQRGRRMF